MLRATYHVEGKSAAELADGLKAHIAILSGSGHTLATEAPPTAPAKRGRPPKTAPKAAKEVVNVDDASDLESRTDQENEDDDIELAAGSISDESEDEEESEDEDEEESEDEDEEEKPKAKEKKAASFTLEDLLVAFQKYIKKHSRDQGLAVLKKFKVSSVRTLDEKHYPQVMAILQKK